MPVFKRQRSHALRALILALASLSPAQPEAEAQQIRWSTSLGSPLGPGSISPEIGELDGNVANGREIVAGTRDGIVTALSSGGTILWQARVPSAECRGLSRTDMLRSSPAIGQLRWDEPPAVVVGYGSMGELGCDGGVIAFDGPTGREKWRFSIPQHAKENRYWAFRYGTTGKPAISKVLSGGKAMVAFGSLSRYIYLLDDRGTPRYFYQAADTVFSSPAFYRDARGREVFAIGQDISANSRLRPPTKNGGYLDVFALGVAGLKSRQVPFRRVEKSGRAGLISMQHFDQVVQSSPRAEEFVAASKGPEIAVTTGCFFPQNTPLKAGRYVSLVDSLNKRTLARSALSACSASTPVMFPQEQILGVLDNGMEIHGGPGSSKLIGLRPVRDAAKKGQLKMHLDRAWEQPLSGVSYWHSPQPVTLSSGEKAIVLGASEQVRFYRAVDGHPVGTIRVSGSIMDSSFATGDVDGDGRSEVAVVSGPGEETRVTLISAR